VKIAAVIPARYASSRFPGKPLALIAGKPMIEWVYQRAVSSGVFSDVLVATDDRRICKVVESFGGSVVMTKPTLPSGTDRVAAAVKGIDADWIMNIQGDEPLIAPNLLRVIAKRASVIDYPCIITAAEKILDPAILDDVNSVKVVINRFGRALYFSRSSIPCIKRADVKKMFVPLKHIGIYLFRRDALMKFVKAKPSLLETTEKLEQLRAFELTIPIEVLITKYSPVNVDVPADIMKVENVIKNIYKR
jgi:3-deoxy-manno-octulosonate cytidylyltransferase (CMP-KDO synthetase)